MKLESLRDLYAEQLKDLYNAEQQLIKALPKMAKAREGEEQEPVLDWPLLGRGARLKNEFHRLEHRHDRGCGKSVRLCT